jgi:putative glutamine amidotransferase
VLEPDSKLAALAGAGPLEANSLHHQGIRQLGKGLRPVARSEDGMVEAVEDPSLPFVLGLQCHPEELAHLAWTSRLFAALVAAAEAWREGAAAFSAAGDGPDYAEGL